MAAPSAEKCAVMRLYRLRSAMAAWGLGVFLPCGPGLLPRLCIELGVAALEAVQRKEQCGAQGVPLAFEFMTLVGFPFELEFRVERRKHMG